MKVFNCILGIFSILGSVYCIFYPGITFLNSGWLVTVLLGAWGICAVFDYFARPKDSGDRSKQLAAMGALGFAAGFAAAVFSVLALFIPGIQLILDAAILGLFAGWLVVSGTASVYRAFRLKKTAESKAWIFTFILGVLVLFSGVYGFFHLIIMARTIGFLFGVLLMAYGVRLICSVFEKNQ